MAARKAKTIEVETVDTEAIAQPVVDFHFELHKETTGWALRLLDRKRNPCEPDHRRSIGMVREVVREFAALRKKEVNTLRWEEEYLEGGGPVVHDPGARLIEMVCDSGLLLDAQLQPVRREPGEARCVLSVQPQENNHFLIIPQVVPEDGLITEQNLEGEGPYAVSSCHLVQGNILYRVADLGPNWMEWDILHARVRQEDLPAFLALALSRFSQLEINYPGYTTRRSGLLTASAGLLFKEIDAYGYLHVKPLAFVPGYPLRFFDDQEIVKVVTIDPEEKQLGIDEVVFPQPPEVGFRQLIAKMGKTSKTAVYEEAGKFIIEPEFAQQFLSEHMSELLAQFILLESHLLARYKLRLGKPRLRLSLGKGIDYFEGKAEIELEHQVFSFGRFMDEYRKNGFITLNDGQRAYPDVKEIKRFERLVTKLPTGDDAVAVSIFDLPALSKSGGMEATGEGWQQAEAFFSGYNTIAERKGKYAIDSGKLRPYQKYAVQWMEYLSDHNLGACLADEMGLGKTVEVIALLRRAYASATSLPSLILVPRSLLYNWKAELQRFAPELECRLYYGAEREVESVFKHGPAIILSSYATIRNDIKALQSLEFLYLILDESQNIKNLGTQTAAAVLSLKAKHRLALSGTPIENNLGDLYSLFRFLNPAFFGGPADFQRKYLRPIQDKNDQDALADLRARVYPFMLRRIKRDVLADLPPKTEQTAYIELDPRHLAIYHRRRLELKEKVSQAVGREGIGKSSFLILQALTELRRLAGIPEADGEFDGVSAKREYLKDMVGPIAAEGHKCLIFTNYLMSVELISEDLDALGIGNLVMTGATGDRQALVHRFQTDPKIQAFIMTLKTGGLGLNLTAADYVFIFDPWWNRSAESQAIDRTHRIGQVNPVFCYRMIARDTIEEKLLELQNTKVSLVSSLLAVDSTAVKSLTEEDIARLLG
jgi:superfamily II DNA or RNA helicase